MGSVSIVGSGISGPAAALALANAGHEVDVYERRSQRDLYSASTIAITTANMEQLQDLGMSNLHYHAAGSKAFRGSIDGGNVLHTTRDDWTTKFNIVVWGDLHVALVNAAERKGARFHWRSNGENLESIRGADIQVHSNGIAYAAHHSEFTSAGYSVFRGAFFGVMPTDAVWTSIHRGDKQLALNVGRAERWSAWMMYVHESNAPMRTEVAQPFSARWHFARQAAENYLPPDWARVVLDSPGEYLVNPMGDWTLPLMLTWNGADYDGYGLHFDIGDAVAPVRPHTTMGANLGIAEALTLPEAVVNSESARIWETKAKDARAIEIARGRQIGFELLGA